MNDHTSPLTNRLSDPRTTRLLMYGSLGVGFVGYIGLLSYDAPVPALAVYWAAFLTFLAVGKLSPARIEDERDAAMERAASQRTVGVIGAVLIGIAPAIPALNAAGIEVPTIALGAIYGFAALMGVWGVAYLWVRYGPGTVTPT